MYGRRCASIKMEPLYHCTRHWHYCLAVTAGSFTLWYIQGTDFELINRASADDENSIPNSINQFAETEFFSIFICNSNPYFCQFRRFYNWTNDSDAQNHFRNSDYDKSTMWPLPSCFIGKYYKNRSFTLRISQFELIILVTAMLRTVNW